MAPSINQVVRFEIRGYSDWEVIRFDERVRENGQLLKSLSTPGLTWVSGNSLCSLRVYRKKMLEPPKSSDTHVSNLQLAFEASFVGKAHISLHTFIVECWEASSENLDRRLYPYTTLVQSSGFGKSRLLSELAKLTQKRKRMRVLYTCIRFGSSSSYPVATVQMNCFFFPDTKTTTTSLADQLYRVYEYAVGNWDSVGGEWCTLFSSGFTQAVTNIESYTKGASTEEPHVQDGVLLFVVDEARNLMEMQGAIADGITGNCFLILRCALELVNRRIRSNYSNDAGVFAILADTNPAISDLVPSPDLNRSVRIRSNPRFELFPPFVLTETMDVHSICESDANLKAYQSLVTRASRCENEQSIWLDIVCMGRPLWKCMMDDVMRDPLYHGAETIDAVVRFAASKLIVGADPQRESSFSEATMFGAASMLCRIGLRAYSCSVVATRTVADFMAILSYASYSHERFVSCYASDPMLALGAAHLWHSSESVLAEQILPQFRKLIIREVLNAGDISVVVARIILLLAMDTCANTVRSYAVHLISFYSVSSFLKVLQGPDISMENDAQGIDMNTVLQELDDRWKGWKMSFSHFVEMEVEPTEQCLWYMLSRRAAGVFPRSEEEDVHLFIPIFKCVGDEAAEDARVSVILVQVQSDESNAYTDMHPSDVFGPSNHLSNLALDQIVRVTLDLRKKSDSSRSYYAVDSSEAQKNISYVLCLEAFQGAGFVSDEIAEQLKLLLCPWWSVTNLIEADVSMHKMEPKSIAPMTEDTLVTNARGALSKYFYGVCESKTAASTRSPGSQKQAKKRKIHECEASIE